MFLGNKGYPQPKTNLKRQSGQVSLVWGMFLLLFLLLLLSAELQLDLYRATGQYMEDALAASNLASAVIDIREYGSTHKLKITDLEAAFERYQTALKGNLGLSEAWECSNKSLISGKVTVAKYVIYNVEGNLVTVYHTGKNGGWNSWQESLDSACAPNGVRIETTAVYSEIYYSVEGIFGVKQTARNGKLVDIILNEKQ